MKKQIQGGEGGPSWEVDTKNVVDRPRVKTIDAGEFVEWGQSHGDNCGDQMTSILDEIVDLEVAKLQHWEKVR